MEISESKISDHLEEKMSKGNKRRRKNTLSTYFRRGDIKRSSDSKGPYFKFTDDGKKFHYTPNDKNSRRRAERRAEAYANEHIDKTIQKELETGLEKEIENENTGLFGKKKKLSPEQKKEAGWIKEHTIGKKGIPILKNIADWDKRQAIKEENWRKRQRRKHNIKKEIAREKHKKSYQGLEENLRNSKRKKIKRFFLGKEKTFEGRKEELNQGTKRANEINSLRQSSTGKLRTDQTAGISAENLKFRDYLFGRKVKGLNKQKQKELAEKDPKAYKKYVRQRKRWESRLTNKKQVGNWAKRHFSEGSTLRRWVSRRGALRAGKAFTQSSSAALFKAGQASGTIGESIAAGAAQSIGPVQVFQLAWSRMSVTLKWLIMITFLVVILFVPWGIFYYAGWAVAAAFMFLIALIYWIFISLFNGIANVLVTLINGIVRVIMGAIIFIVEALLSFFTQDANTYKYVPDPNWAANFKSGQIFEGETLTNPWDHPGFLRHEPGYAIRVKRNYWFDGHVLMEASLIRFDEIANVPSLMFVSPPEWQDWMYDILIVKLLEHIPGLKEVGRAWDQWMGQGIANAIKEFTMTAPPWLVILIGCMPFIILAAVIIYFYLTFKRKMESSANYQPY